MTKYAITPFGLRPIMPMMFKHDACGCTAKPPMKLDVKETETEYDIETDLPGADKADVSVKLEDEQLTISYTASEETGKKDEDGQWLTHERRNVSMSRTMYLPNADEDNTEAKLENGVLKLIVGKKVEETKSKEIEIQ